MSYTTADLVRQHLATPTVPLPTVRRMPVTMAGTDPLSLNPDGVEDDSVVVKAIRSSGLTRDSVTLNSGGTFIGSTHIVPDTVVLASDSSLGTIYAEFVDYTVNFDTGIITILPDGALNTGTTVTVWYRPFHIFEPDIDYKLDGQKGRIARLSQGDILDGQTVLVDFVPSSGSLTDELIAAAVAEANGLTASQVDPQQEFGAAPSLQVAATNRALAVLARSAAARALTRPAGDDRLALAWIRLSGTYDGRADELLKNFRPPFSGPAMPALT